MGRRVPQDCWLVKAESGEELTIVNGAAYEDALENAKAATGLDGGFSMRRLKAGERVGEVDRNTTPGLFY